MALLMILSYTGALCGIVGFIISPGLTIIYPWLKEKFNDKEAEQTRDFLETDFFKKGYYEIYNADIDYRSKYKWDWRPSIRKKLRDLKELRKNREDEIKGKK